MEGTGRAHKGVLRMIEYNYQKLIDGLNDGKIKQIHFSLSDYNHYKDCLITRKEDNIFNGKTITLIEVKLTKDSSEKISFLNTFEENYKLFNLGKKGRFTLKQLWSKINIIEIIQAAKD